VTTVDSLMLVLSLDEFMNHELSPYPPALFEAKQVLRKADKAQQTDALEAHVTAISDDTVLEIASETEQYWQHQDIIYDFQAQIEGTGSRSKVSRVNVFNL